MIQLEEEILVFSFSFDLKLVLVNALSRAYIASS
jgi:hypothetical protein